MDTVFVSHVSDEKGVAALRVLKEAGYETVVLEVSEKCPSWAHIAVFGIDSHNATVGGSGHYVRAASHRLPPAAPSWVNTPFTIGVISHIGRPLPTKKGRTKSTFAGALLSLAKSYKLWIPGLTGFKAPWHPDPANPAPEHAAEFKQWEWEAKRLLGTPTLPDILEYHLEAPIIGDNESVRRAISIGGKARLVIMGCAPFNGPHTDVASQLLPEKADAARSTIRRFILDSQNYISEVLLVIAGGDFLSHPALKASLHPFFWPDVSQIEESLGEKFSHETRLWGKIGERTDAEVAEAMEYGYALVANEVLLPLQADPELRVPIRAVRWTELVGLEILNTSWGLAQTNQDLARRIYQERVGTRFWYETIDRINPDAGLMRTVGNNAVYIATIFWAAANPDSIIIDAEVDDQFWNGLKPLLQVLWEDNEPYVASLPHSVSQPRAY